MAKVILIGVNHNDPFGRKKVESVLRRMKDSSFMPDSIAVEWDHLNAQRVINQRPLFRALAKERYPQTDDEEIMLLSQALAYEADSFVSFFPDVPIIWLDEKRPGGKMVNETYAKRRLSTYAQFTDGSHFNLMNLSQNLLNLGEKWPITPDEDGRDDLFTEAVMRAVIDGNEKIICIVGEKHMRHEVPGMFGEQLLKQGCDLRCYDTTVFPDEVIEYTPQEDAK